MASKGKMVIVAALDGTFQKKVRTRALASLYFCVGTNNQPSHAIPSFSLAFRAHFGLDTVVRECREAQLCLHALLRCVVLHSAQC